MDPAEIDILIHRQLSGAATGEEHRVLETWLSETDANRSYYEQLRLLWDEAGEVDLSLDSATPSEWEKLKERIARKDNEAPSEAPVRRLSAVWRYAAAAVVVLGLFALWRLFLSAPAGLPLAQTYETAPGEIRTVTLPDGSTVTLNAASFLGVAEGFGETERRVELRGEGFFAVTSDASRPFIIESGPVRTQVLGTAFNLRAYAEEATVALTVTEGRVSFSTLGTDAAREVGAGMAAFFDREAGEIQTVPFDDRAGAWRDGWIIFDNTPLTDVWRTLERRYAVRVDDRSGQGSRTYTTTFENEELTTVLEVLRQTFDLQIRREGDRVTVE